MKIAGLLSAVAILFSALAGAQQVSAPPGELFFDKGVIVSGVYTNQCLGFSLPIPDGWHTTTLPGLVEGKALRMPGGGLGLLFIDRKTDKPFGDRIAINAVDASKATLTVQASVSATAHRQVDSDPARREMIRDAFAVEYAGKQFFRADSKQDFPDGSSLYLAVVYTRFRQYLVGVSITAGSPEALDEAASSLGKMVFQEDLPNPACVMGPDDGPRLGVVGGIISSKPGKVSATQRVLLSSMVANDLLIKRVEAEYPVAARQAHIQGRVMAEVNIDASGNVEDVTLISGDPVLAPAALESIKQWKYKPYTLNGQPVKIVTQVTVTFSLQAN